LALRRLGRFALFAGPPLLSGAAMALSLPPFGFWVVAFAGAAGLWWQLGHLRWPRRLAAGWLFGLGLYGIGLWWVTDFNVYGGLLLIVVEALAPAVAALVTPRGRGRTPALVGAMVMMEMLRSSWPLGGLPLGGVALGQAAGPLADTARLGGPELIVGLVWLAGAGLGALVVTGARRLRLARRSGREAAGWRELTGGAAPAGVRTLAPVAVAGPVVAGVVAIGVVVGLGVAGRLAPDGGAAVSRLRVAAVQGGGVRGLSKAEVPPSTVFDAQVAATDELIGAPGPKPSLIVWPEDVISLDRPLRGSPEEQTVSALARRAGATLLAGVTEPAGPGRFRNEIVAVSPQGRIVSTFEKVHRVPFGEYVPWRGLIKHLANLSAVPEDAVPGHGNGLMRTPAGPLGVMVSYEVFFSARGQSSTRAGATLLVVPTNTSSYSTAQVPTQEVAADRLQALAEGRDLVQAAPTGFSDLVDHDGRVLRRSDLGSRSEVVGTLSRRTGRTVYERFGDLPVLVAAALAVAGAWLWLALAPVGGRRRTTFR
jgi:apolipoprotein N-acyltransferase